MIPAWAVANCMRTHSYLLGPHIPSRSPFFKPRARSPAAAWSTCKTQDKCLRISNSMHQGIFISRHYFLGKNHHLCNRNQTECASAAQSVSLLLQQDCILVVKAPRVDAHLPVMPLKNIKTARRRISVLELKWLGQHKGELFITWWAHGTSGHQGRDNIQIGLRSRGDPDHGPHCTRYPWM